MTTSGPIPLSQSTTFNALVNRVTSLETEVGNGAFNSITVIGNGRFGGIVQAVSPNNGTTGAICVRANVATSEGYLQFTDNAASAEYAYLKATSAQLLFHVGGAASYQFLAGATSLLTLSAAGGAAIGDTNFALNFNSGVQPFLSFDNGDNFSYIRSTNTFVWNVGNSAVLSVSATKVTIPLAELPIYADNTAAIAGGLGQGDLYRTSAGAFMVRF